MGNLLGFLRDSSLRLNGKFVKAFMGKSPEIFQGNATHFH